MKAETKLNKILKMDDGRLKLLKLFGFCMDFPWKHSILWNKAKVEFDRLINSGYKMM